MRFGPVACIVTADNRADRRRTILRHCGFSLAQAAAANSLAEWPAANTITLLRMYDVLVRHYEVGDLRGCSRHVAPVNFISAKVRFNGKIDTRNSNCRISALNNGRVWPIR